MMKVSVLLPIYSGDKLEYLKFAVDSILNQTYKDFQLILCIDGPITKKLNNYIYFLEDERIIIHVSNINIGLPAILNQAIKKYKSHYYFRMDADDISDNKRIEKVLNVFNEDKNLLLIGSESVEIDEYGREIFYKKLPTENKDMIKWSFTRSPIIHVTVCFKKDFFDIVGFYNENYRKSQDYELWSRALLINVKMLNIHEPLMKVRIYSDMFKRRAKWQNIKNETKVSLVLINHLRAYNHLPKLFTKFSMRVLLKYLPAYFSKLAYKLFR